MKEVKKHIQNWEDVRITDIPKLGDISIYKEERVKSM